MKSILIIKLVIVAVLMIAMDVAVFIIFRKKRRMVKVTTRVSVLLLDAAVIMVTIYCIAPSFLFYKNYDPVIYSEVKNYSDTEEVIIDSDNGKICGWFLHNADDGAPLILYFGGNGENASRRMRMIHEENLADRFAGYNLVMFNYPGYEKSEGEPDSDTLKAMGLAVYDAMVKRNDVDRDRIFIWGFSIGTGVSNYVAANRDIGGMLLLAPYSNGFDLYNRYLPIFYGPLQLMVAYDMAAEEFAKSVKVRPVVLASRTDEVVSYSSSENLVKNYPEGCDFHTIEGIRHNDFCKMDETLKLIEDFFAVQLEKADY